jgi:2-oxoisovalerate dehydrogenase E1 component alpha subunit
MPALDVASEDTHDLAHGLVRVLDDEGNAGGDWQPSLTPEELRRGLRHMMHVRAYDDRMFRMQRQGQLSFYMKCTGEEAVAVAQATALEHGDMLFPTYRQQGLLFVRGRPVVDMMCHCISNAGDNLKGRQMPVFYSWKEGNFFSISGNLATQYSQAVGWAMASAYKGEDHIAAAWVGDGSTAESDVHNALLFAATYRAPVILNVVNNQWAISTPQSFASAGTTFAARGLGYSIPSLRVDGNDFLAVYAVTRWAAERARQGFGPSFIEHFTYRVEGHSTSDNPDGYRARDEAQRWPLGDPIERLKQHLVSLGEWSDEQHSALEQELTESITRDWKESISYGTLEDGPHWPVESMFEDVFKEMPEHLRRQREKLMGQP